MSRPDVRTELRDRTDVVVDFDHHRPATEVDPHEAYEALRRTCPVSWSEAHGGYWVVTKHHDVDQVMKDYRFFSSKDGVAIPPHSFGRNVPVDMDPPEHTAYRRALNPVLTKEAVAAMADRVARCTDLAVDRVIESGHCDLIYDIAVDVPASVTLGWVGWDDESEWPLLGTAWHDLISRPRGDPRQEKAQRAIAFFDGRIGELLEARRREPRDDVITHIAQTEIDGEPITHQNAVGLVRICIAGGVDTVTSLIGSALVHLHRNPDHRRRLLEEPELWETATEEFLRVYPPVRTIARTVRQAVEVGGCRMNAEERVLAALGSAGYDEDEFPDPGECVLDRQPNRHLAFGAGIHRCVGLHLARAEFRQIVSRVLERMPDYSVDEAGLVPYARQSEVAGWMHAPATFTPGVRVYSNP